MRLALIVVAVVLIAVPFGILLLEVLLKGPVARVDRRIANQQNSDNLGNATRVHRAELVTNLGSTVVLVAVVVAAAVVLVGFHRHRRQALFLVTTAVMGVVTNTIIKALWDAADPISLTRPRMPSERASPQVTQ